MITLSRQLYNVLVDYDILWESTKDDTTMLSSVEPKKNYQKTSTSSYWWDHKITQAQEEITFKHLLKEYTNSPTWVLRDKSH